MNDTWKKCQTKINILQENLFLLNHMHLSHFGLSLERYFRESFTLKLLFILKFLSATSWGGEAQEEVLVSSLATDDRTGRSSTMLCHGKVGVEIRKNASVVKVVEHLPTEVVDAPCLSRFKRCWASIISFNFCLSLKWLGSWIYWSL